MFTGKLEKSGELPSGKPKFTSPLQSELTVIDGQSVSLECQLNADPNPNILWYKDGRVLRPSIGYKQTFDGSVAKIEIREVFLDDTGMYECAAKNGHGEERCSCKLKVKGRPLGPIGFSDCFCVCLTFVSFPLDLLLVSVW